MRRWAVVLLLAGSGIAAGCSDDDSAPFDRRLSDSYYSVTNVQADDFEMSMEPSTDGPSVTFGGGQIGVEAACLSLQADYQIDDSGTLTIRQADPPTGVQCDDPVSEALAELFGTSGAKVTGEPGDLTVERGGTTVHLRQVITD